MAFSELFVGSEMRDYDYAESAEMLRRSQYGLDVPEKQSTTTIGGSMAFHGTLFPPLIEFIT